MLKEEKTGTVCQEAKDKGKQALGAVKKAISHGEAILVHLASVPKLKVTQPMLSARADMKANISTLKQDAEIMHSIITFGTDMEDQPMTSDTVKIMLGGAASHLLAFLDQMDVAKTMVKVATTK